MKTHTIRINKTKSTRILTTTPAFEAKLLAAHPWAARALIGALLKETGTVLDSESTGRLTASLVELPVTSYQQHRALSWLQSGFRLLDTGVEEGLDVLDFAAQALFGATATPRPAG